MRSLLPLIYLGLLPIISFVYLIRALFLFDIAENAKGFNFYMLGWEISEVVYQG